MQKPFLRTLALLGSCGLGIAVKPRPAPAQPVVIDPDTVTNVLTGMNPEERDQKAWEALQKQTAAQEKDNPQAAIDAYRAFLTQHPHLAPSIGVKVALSLGRLWREGLKKNDQAIATYDWALAKYKDDPPTVEVLTNYAQTLLVTKQPEQVETLLQGYWPQLTHTWRHMAVPAFNEWANALEQQHKTDDKISLLAREMVVFPSLAQGDTQYYEYMTFNPLTDALIQQKRGDEALGWAKLRFMVCAYDSDQIDRATRLLIKMWSATDPDKKGLTGFAAAEKDPTLPNPLAAVKLPPIDAAVLAQTMQRLPAGHDGATERIILLLWQEQPGAAMREAQKLLRPNNSSEGALEVCRVFKATDLNLKRANAFLTYLKTPTGPNPIDTFLKEQAGKGA